VKEILVLHVRLVEIAPAIWRRLEIRAEGTFWHLHCAIQDAMPWEDRHLHEFRFPTGDTETRIGIPGFDEFEEDEEPRLTPFQFRNTGNAPLKFIIATTPPWPGAQEARPEREYWDVQQPNNPPQ
jgi:hypothetical protein